MEKVIELKPISEPKKDYEAIELRLKKLFREKIYLPLIKELGISSSKTLKNAEHPNPLMDALFIGRVTYDRGVFSGNFNAKISQELKSLGARFHRKTGTYRLSQDQLPQEMKNVISSSHDKFQKKIDRINKKLSELVPETLAKEFKCVDLFDRTIWHADREFRENVKKIAVVPHVSPQQRNKIAEDWQNNMDLWIQDFTSKEIKQLRAKIQKSVFTGNRYDQVQKLIQKSYGVSADKAKFLASQETRLLLTTFKQARYEEAGSKSYIWRCVHRPKDTSPKQHTPGNVRYAHGLLDGTEIEWSNPPITTNPGEPVRRNHAGQDYNCRCHARPRLKIKIDKP